jgi:hypothetical protein
MNTFKENPKYLKDAVLSYVKQRNVNIHLIISTLEGDPSIEFVKRTFSEPRYAKENLLDKIEFCVSTKKEHPGKGIAGIYYQLNKATGMIKEDSEWFCYASSNDVAVITKCEQEIAACLKAKKQVCYSAYAKTNALLKSMKPVNFHQFNYLKLLKGNFISDCSLIKTALLRRFLPFDARYYNCGFWDLWLRIYNEVGNVFVYSPGIAFLYRITPQSTHIQRQKEVKKKQIYAKGRETMRVNILRRYPLFKRATVKSSRYRHLSGLYQLQCTSIPIYKKGKVNLVRYKNGTYKFVQNRKVLATHENKDIVIQWQYQISKPSQVPLVK